MTTGDSVGVAHHSGSQEIGVAHHRRVGDGRCWVTPLIHPASVLRGAWNKDPAQVVYLKRLVAGVKEDREPCDWDIQRPPTLAQILLPSRRQLDRWVGELAVGPWNILCLDIESAGPHLICCGILPVHLQVSDAGEVMAFGTGTNLCLRFRVRGGRRYWSTFEDHLHAVKVFDTLLTDPTLGKLFHNGITFDVPMLVGMGFRVDGEMWDTMVMHHEAYKEMPKGLQYLATLYCGAPVWKTLTSEDDEGEGKA